MDCRTEFLAGTISALVGIVDDNTLQRINRIMEMQLQKYTMTVASMDLAVVDTESESLIKMFLATKRIEGRSELTLERYGYIIRRMMTTLNIPIKKIDVFALRLYLGMLGEDGCKASTINGIRSIMSSFFSWLADSGFIQSNPAKQLGSIKVGKEIRKPYSAVEIEKLREACGTERDRALIEFMLATGCRVSEVVGCDIADVDFRGKEARVLGKGNKERIVFLDDTSIWHLQRYLAERKDNEQELFRAKRGGRLLQDGIRTMLKRLEEKSGVQDVHPHRFRRTCATGLINRGMSVQDVATILGHSNINVTMTYVYSDVSQVKAAYVKASD